MAWRNIRLNTNWPGAVQCDVSDFSLLSLTTWPSSWGSYISNEPASVLSDFKNGIFFGTSPNYVEGIIASSDSCTIRVYCSGWNNAYGYGNVFLDDSSVRWGYIACVDDDTQKGFFCMLLKRLNTGNTSNWAGTVPPYPNTTKDNTNVRSKMYTLLTGNEYSPKKSGGAGSGYIGNSLVSNKKMVGYNVPTSDAINTKTESVQVYSAAPLSNMPKMGDGFARIKLIRESLEVNFWDIVLKSDLSAAVNCGSAPSTAQWNSDDILFYGETQKTKPTVTDGVFYHVGSTDYTRSCVSFPLKQEYIILGGSSKVNFIAKAQDAYHNQWIHAAVLLEKVYGKFLSEYAYTVSEYPEASAVDAFGLYESAKNLSSPQTVRRITVRFDYGTWEMFDIKVIILG